MHKTIAVLRDVLLESQTASRDLEYDDPALEHLCRIEEMTNIAIKNLEAQIGDTDAA